MKIQNLRLARPLYAVAALAMVLGLGASSLLASRAYAYGQINDRAIKMSSSQQSATGTNYELSFTPTAAVLGVAIDFCSESPLFQDTCVAGVAGLSLSSATLSATQTGASGWTVQDSPTATHIEAGGSSVAGGTPIVLTFQNITNPSTLGTFYARVYTYAASNPNWTGVGTAGTVVDFGGVALSTAQAVNITARVQEKLQFCVSKADPGANCTATSAPDLTLGHGTPQILDESQADSDTAYIQVSTNAQSGVVIRMKNSNTCGGLSRDSGATCNIPAVGAGGNASLGYALSGAGFGLYCTPAGTLTAAAPYDGGGSTQYGMDTTTSGSNVTTTYGSTILSSAGAVNQEESTLTFGARAALTTPAGIYTATMDLIATGTF